MRMQIDLQKLLGMTCFAASMLFILAVIAK